jgi:hypothetical protein
MTVVILTYCEHPALAYGALMVFETLRVGFPTAEVIVIDNGSHPDVVPLIEKAALNAGCSFTAAPRQHFLSFYRWMLLEQESMDTVVLLDPDVVFWKSVEDWQFDGLMAGRLIPDLYNYGVTSLSRLHPSHLWVPDVAKLRAALGNTSANGFDPLRQFSAPANGKMYFWDTGAGLYQALASKCESFSEAQLDCYDHLFYGSHLPVIQPALNDEDLTYTAHQAAARGELASLKGIWRAQDEHFKSQRQKALSGETLMTEMIETCAALGKIQGVQTGYDEAVDGLISNIRAQL